MTVAAKICAALAVLLLAALPASGRVVISSHPTPIGITTPPPTSPFCANHVLQTFPTSGPPQTAWLICWHEVKGYESTTNPNGLVIGPVYFQKALTSAWILVLVDMRVSDYFVPYHSGSPRYYDLSGFDYVLGELTPGDCPASAGGKLLSLTVCEEVHDRGLDWKDHLNSRRGEELVLWGAIDCANYQYIQQYTFRDDGTIVGQLGATGQNAPGDELMAHAHNVVWRIDMELGGTRNSVAHVSHSEDISGLGAQDHVEPLTTAQGFAWGARSHDALLISNPGIVNAQGRVVSYMLMPLVTGGGLTQHHEAFTQNDFWVTPFRYNQFAASALPSYVAGSPRLGHIVVWYKGSIHHAPRSEDGMYVDRRWIGVAHTMWTGFMLMPHDLFDCSPLYHQACP